MDDHQEQPHRLKKRKSISGDQLLMVHKWKTIDKDQKVLPVDVQNFAQMVTQYKFSIDKTMLIHLVVLHEHKSLTITRMRRSGKSLNLNMLQLFLEKNIDNRTGLEMPNKSRVIFCGGEFKTEKSKIIKLNPLQIAEDQEFINQHQGAYPVIYLDLKEIEAKTCEQFLNQFRQRISKLCGFKFLYLQAYFQKNNKTQSLKMFNKFLEKTLDKQQVVQSLDYLATWLHQFHKKRVVLLIDEFDHPISHMLYSGQDMNERQNVKSILKCILSSVLKTSNTYLFKAVLIGIMDVFSSNDDSGLNNCYIMDICEERHQEFFGFSYPQLKDLVINTLNFKFAEQYHEEINYYVLQIMEKIQNWFYGYEIVGCKTKFFNSYSVIKYLSKCLRERKICKPEPFWESTKSDDFFFQIFKKTKSQFFKKISELTIESKTRMTFKFAHRVDISKISLDQINERQLSYMFLQTGYLTGSNQQDQFYLIATIPNNQILNKLVKFIFIRVYENFLSKLSQGQKELASKLMNLKLEESNTIQQILNFILSSENPNIGGPNQPTFSSIFFSFFYKNLRHLLSMYMVTKSGGRLGHIFYPRRFSDSTCVIIHQYKYDPTGQKEQQLCIEALWQIYSKRYMDHALTERDVDYNYILVRGIVICNNICNKKYDVQISREQFHSIEQAKGICLFFQSLNFAEQEKAKAMFFKEYLSNKSSRTMLEVINKIFCQENILNLQNYNKDQQQVFNEIFKKVKSEKSSKEEFKESERIRQQEELRMEQLRLSKIQKNPKNFDYNQVGPSISRFIGQNWWNTNNIAVVNFKSKFQNGQSLYNISVGQILTVEGISEQYAKKIYENIQNMKSDSQFFNLPRKRCENK